MTAAALPARTFGIELEVIGSMRVAYDALRAAGIDARMPGYTHSRTAFWKLVPDGSVSRGFEVVSPVLSGEAGITEARAVADALTAAGFTVDQSCGFHVHVGAGDLTADDIRTLAKRYAAYEATIDGWMPRSRRGSNNHYCRPVATVAQRLENRPATGTARDQIATALGTNIHDRYYKLNLQSFWRHGTVEFRQHSGTVDAQKVENWTRFCLAFVDVSRGTPAATAYTPRADYQRTSKRNYANIIEQVEAAGLTMAVSAPRARTYRIAGPNGVATATVAELTRLYTSPTSPTLDAVRFEAWWTATVAPLAARTAAGEPAADDVFAGVPDAVRAFLTARGAHFARGGAR